MRHFLQEDDFNAAEVARIFALAQRFKAERGRHEQPLAGQTWALLFSKSSTRTRVSFEVGIHELGGNPLFLSKNDIQIGRGETIPDTARVLSRFVHGLIVRTYAHKEVVELARHATVPVVMSASGQLTHVRISLEFAGISWVVKDKVVSSSVYTDTIPVKNYDRYGVGLYEVTGSATGPGFSCSGSALIRVEGSPFASYLGIGGLVVALLGAAGVLLGAFGAKAGIAPLRFVGSALAGLLGAAGVLVLLQEAALLYPTRLVAIVGLVLGLAVGTAAAGVPLLRRGAGRGALGGPATPAL
jgi:hypothetical protein